MLRHITLTALVVVISFLGNSLWAEDSPHFRKKTISLTRSSDTPGIWISGDVGVYPENSMASSFIADSRNSAEALIASELMAKKEGDLDKVFSLYDGTEGKEYAGNIYRQKNGEEMARQSQSIKDIAFISKIKLSGFEYMRYRIISETMSMNWDSIVEDKNGSFFFSGKYPKTHCIWDVAGALCAQPEMEMPPSILGDEGINCLNIGKPILSKESLDGTFGEGVFAWIKFQTINQKINDLMGGEGIVSQTAKMASILSDSIHQTTESEDEFHLGVSRIYSESLVEHIINDTSNANRLKGLFLNKNDTFVLGGIFTPDEIYLLLSSSLESSAIKEWLYFSKHDDGWIVDSFWGSNGELLLNPDITELLLLDEAGAISSKEGADLPFTLSPQEHDFGAVKAGEEIKLTLEIVRPEGLPFRVGRVMTSCDCVTASISKNEFSADESAQIFVAINPRATKDQQHYTVSVEVLSDSRLVLQTNLRFITE